jgi:hypothetical protein
VISAIWRFFRRVAEVVLATCVRVLDWLLRPFAWLIRHWWRSLRKRGWVGRVATLLGTALVVAAAVLAVSVPWPGYLFQPPFRAVEYAPINDLQRLRVSHSVDGVSTEARQCRARRDSCREAETLAAEAARACDQLEARCAALGRECARSEADAGACADSTAFCARLVSACARPAVPAHCAAEAARSCPEETETWQGWSREDRMRFYYHPQGSAQVMLARMRYAWFTNLELPFTRDKLADPENMSRYGFLVDVRQQPDPDWNPGNLPVGFTKYYDQKIGAELLDFTCSLCHTGELHYQGTAIRIDGGQAMHAVTDMKPGQFQADLMSSMLATYFNPWKFRRFARAVILPAVPADLADAFNIDAARKQLRAEFGASIRELLANAWTDIKYGNYPVFEGYGRTDATQRIANTVFGRHISAENYRPATAPVSYPHLWDIAKFNWVQWEGYASQPMARNINESLGVGARLELFDEFGAPLPMHLRYDTSIDPVRLHEIESTLARLEAPAWPEHLFGRPDMAKARQGRVLFDVHCRHCHGPHLTAHEGVPPATELEDRHLDVNIRHNPDGSCALVRHGEVVDEVSAGQCLNLHNPQRLSDIDGQPYYAVDEHGRVTGKLGDAAIEEWRVEVIPLTDIGTDRNAALNFADHRYDATRLGWTKDEMRSLCMADEIVERIDPASVSAVEGLNLMSTAITNRYFERHPPASAGELMKYMGFGIIDYPRTDPERLKNYKSRPLHGIWATPPFLHNGSVRTIYQMISPREERESEFWSGTKEYDPVDLGYRNLPVPGAVLFDTRVTGNDNTGHEFRDGCQSNGVIGPYLRPEERRAILEYIKVMDYVKDDGAYEPALCREDKDKDKDEDKNEDKNEDKEQRVAICEAGMDADKAALQAKYPAWGSPAFRRGIWQGHCSDNASVYGQPLPPTLEPDDEWTTWRMASDCSLFDLYMSSEDPFRGE